MRKQALLALSLLLAASAEAQTLLDTSATIGISNTLNQSLSAPNIRMPEVPQAVQATETGTNDLGTNDLGTGNLAASELGAGEQVQLMRPAASAPVAGATPNAAMPEAKPLTVEQSEQLRTALQHLDSGSPEVAQQGFERIISQNFLQPEPHFGLAIALLEQGRTEAARFELNQLLKLAPDRYEAAYNLGVLAQQEGDNAAALEYFTQAASLTSEQDPSIQNMVLGALAYAQTRAGDYSALQGTLEQMYALTPSDAALALRLARVQALNGMGPDALPLAYEALADEATRADAASLLADIYLAQRLPDRALSEIESALSQQENAAGRSMLLTRRAALLAGAGRPEEARADALLATRLDPENAAAYAQLGSIRAQLGETGAAIAAYREAARLSPNNGFYRTELGLLRLNAGEAQAARNDALLALKMPDPQVQARAELLLGLRSYRAGNYAQAAAELQGSAAKLPSAQAYYWLGLAAYQQGDYAASAAALSNSAQLDPQVQTRISLGSALLAGGRYAEAEALLRGVTAEAAGQAEAWYLLGVAQRELGQAELAAQSFRTGASLGNVRAQGAMQ